MLKPSAAARRPSAAWNSTSIDRRKIWVCCHRAHMQRGWRLALRRKQCDFYTGLLKSIRYYWALRVVYVKLCKKVVMG